MQKAKFWIDGVPVSLGKLKRLAREEMTKGYMPSKKACAALNISPARLREFQKEGKVRAVKVGATWFYSQEDLLKIIPEL